MSEWYVYLGWVLAIISITMMIAIMLVRKPPYEYDDNNRYTIAFSYNMKIHLIQVTMNNPTDAERVLQLYEQAYNKECMPDMHIYEYDLVGVIKGHVKWL